MKETPTSDARQRQRALDTQRSFIVQAPAGSGKTELLTQRYLALLAQVDDPQQILAITFTRKAAAEMRSRLLEALEAGYAEAPVEAHKRQTWELARAVLMQDTRKNWSLLENPARLSVQTIDSFNSSLVRKMPWLSRFGGLPQLAEDAAPLYQGAVDQLLQRLGSSQPGAAQLRYLIGHLDNRVTRLQQMLMTMLARRDQWLRHVYRPGPDPCAALEAALTKLTELELGRLAQTTPGTLVEEILACGRHAAHNLAATQRPLLYLTDLDWWPGAQVEHLPIWQGLADLLLTAKGELRRGGGINARIGFPAAEREANQRMKRLIEALQDSDDFIQALAGCSALPNPEYLPEQRQVLQALLELLPLLVAELWLEFRRSGQADFAEIALMAKEALGSASDPGELLLQLDHRLEHILVDEFQDTSRLQYALLELLTAGWQAEDGRSLFLVGDPMQSIYLFREAEVGLFLQSFTGQLGAAGPRLEPLRLKSNFRSCQGLVDWVNSTFRQIFPPHADPATGAVSHAAASAVNGPGAAPAVSWHALPDDDAEAEALAVVERLEQIRAQEPGASVAILVRGRNHLNAILPQLLARGLRYQAQDIDPLGARPAAQDIHSLYQALSNRADRLAWLAILRAPWCGLELADMEVICRTAGARTIPATLATLAGDLASVPLSETGRQRLVRCWPHLEQALRQRGRLPLRRLLEACWLALGGPACYDPQGQDDALRVLDLFESLQQGTELITADLLERGMERLFAASDSQADGSLQVMTIHKSKGLEFDHVLLPGLGRIPAANDSPLLRWLEHPQVGLLLAPIAARDGSDQDPIYRLIGRLEQQKQDFEATRLLYVAATRARHRLHLFGHARENSRGERQPAANSLLAKLWPACGVDFCAQLQPTTEQREMLLQPLKLGRLPLRWQLPRLEAVSILAVHSSDKVIPEQEEARPQMLFSGWEEQTSRQVGTLVHGLLERLALQGADWWRALAEEEQLRLLQQQLGALGVPRAEQPEAGRKVLRAIEKTLASERGRWILQPHSQAACELELSGTLAGEVVHLVIDRTFVSQDGTRWVIDYKTSLPQKEESLEAFVTREIEHYRAQLNRYLSLIKTYAPQHQARAALYFPLLDIFALLPESYPFQ